MKNILFIFLTLCVIFFTSALRADDFSDSETDLPAGNFTGAEQHDGFFLRFLYGVGKASITEEDYTYYGQTGDITFSGASSIFNFQLGGAPVDNFILFGGISIVAADEPKVKWKEVNETAYATTLYIDDYDFGFCYYIMPENIYFSAAVTLPVIVQEMSGETGTSNRGTGLSFAIGKEWWVSDNWGLGVAIIGSILRTTAEDIYGDKKYLNGWYWGVCFSATYN